MWRSLRAGEFPAALGVGLALLTCYWATAPRTVVLEDDGYFLQAAWFNAVAHPPGYPLYVALAHLATLVPAGSVALRVHALTGIMAAIACVLLFHLARRLDLSRGAAVVAALALGFSGAYWSQAIIAEVYALNVLLFLACAHLALGLGRDPGSVTPRALMTAGLFYGLGLANHWPLLVLSTPALLALAWPAWRKAARGIAPLLLGMGAGLLPYAWMIWRTHVVPEYCFAGPIDSWESFRFYVAREGYAAQDHSATAGWWDRVQFTGFVAGEAVRQLGWPGAALAVTGFAAQWRRFPRHVCFALLLAFAGSTFLLILLLGFDYDALHRYTFRVYPLIAWSVAAVWIGLGLQQAARYCSLLSHGAVSEPRAALSLGALVVGVIFLTHLPGNLRRGDDWAEHYGRAVLDSLPPGARFYGNADTVNGPVGYLQRVVGLRPDITFVTGTSLPWRGTLYRPYAMPAPALESLLADFVRGDRRPVFYSNGFPNAFGQDDYGLYFGVNTAGVAGDYRVAGSPPVLEYFRVLDGVTAPADPWESMHLRLLRQDQCRWQVARAAGAVNPAALPPACRGLQGRVWIAQQIIAAGADAATTVLALLPADTELQQQAVTKAELVHYFRLRARALERVGDAPGAAEAGDHARRLAPGSM